MAKNQALVLKFDPEYCRCAISYGGEVHDIASFPIKTPEGSRAQFNQWLRQHDFFIAHTNFSLKAVAKHLKIMEERRGANELKH